MSSTIGYPELAYHLCPNHTICIADHFIHYPSLLQNSEDPSRKWTLFEHFFF